MLGPVGKGWSREAVVDQAQAAQRSVGSAFGSAFGSAR